MAKMREKVLTIFILTIFSQPWRATGKMQVDLYAQRDKFGKSLSMDVSEHGCTNVPRPWVNNTMSIDTHGRCMQFYDKKDCYGRIAAIQPFHTFQLMDLSLIKFDNVIQSMSACGEKVISGRYVIQSALDASILTVTKHENQFANVMTVPPLAFIPKSQQWDIREKATDSYDIVPRLHEANVPLTYSREAMKKGSFIRRVWKIESVGRGRYIIRDANEWEGNSKCLYKTRFRDIEENDCRSWTPNQEWVFRPLASIPKAKKVPVSYLPTREDEVYVVPSPSPAANKTQADEKKKESEEMADDEGDESSEEEKEKVHHPHQEWRPIFDTGGFVDLGFKLG